MKSNFLENNHVIHVAPVASVTTNADLGDGAAGAILLCDVMSLKNADGAVFIVTTSANAGGAMSLIVAACDDILATTTVAVSFKYMTITAPDTIAAVGESVQFLTSTGADYVYVLEVDASKVAEQGYEFVRLVGTEATNAAIEGAVVGFLTGLRYKEDNIGTQVT
jgi:hypothetical protein